MEINKIQVYGFETSFRGLRNPFNSWDRSDSTFKINNWEKQWNSKSINIPEVPLIGPKDLELACKLVKGGSEHRKFLRQINISFDITIPIYIWSELDTYCIGKTRNSCSTMHTLGLRDLTQEDFELNIDLRYLEKLNYYGVRFRHAKKIKNIAEMNVIRREYKNALPSGFLQKATYSMNYETALSMYFQRRNHRLPEWNTDNPLSICSMIASLPYMKEFIEAANK
jgi:hypothetical protein